MNTVLPADKGRITVVMDKTKYTYFDKMDALVNNKQTYEELKCDPTPALQCKVNSKILTLKKKTHAIDAECYYRLRFSVPQPAKLYFIKTVQTWWSPTYQLSRYLTTMRQPLTDKSRHKLQSLENFIDAIKTVQIPTNLCLLM